MTFPRVCRRDAARIALIAESFQRLLGEPLVVPPGDLMETLRGHPAVILAHGTELDPRFFFANRAALERFEASPEQPLAPRRRGAFA